MGVFDFMDVRHPMWGTGRFADMDKEKEERRAMYEPNLSPIPTTPYAEEQAQLEQFLTAQKELAPKLTTGPFRNTGLCEYMKRDGVHVRVTGQSLHNMLFRDTGQSLESEKESENEHSI